MAAKKVNAILGYIKRGKPSRNNEVIVPLPPSNFIWITGFCSGNHREAGKFPEENNQDDKGPWVHFIGRYSMGNLSATEMKRNFRTLKETLWFPKEQCQKQ